MRALALTPSQNTDESSSQTAHNPTPAFLQTTLQTAYPAVSSSKNNTTSPPPPPPSKPLQLPKHSNTYRRPKNTKNLSLTFPPLSDPLHPHTAPARAASMMDLAPLQTSIPAASGSGIRKQDISAHSAKMICSPKRAPTSHFDRSRSPPTARLKPLGTNLSSIYSTTVQPTLQKQPALSRALSLKIPTSPKNTNPPSLLPPSSFTFPSNDTLSLQPPSPFDPNSVVVNSVPPPFQDECMETGVNVYPHGPLFICEPNIYLYSEPTREEALKFDVIINVAREVKNPFDEPSCAPVSSNNLKSSISYSSSCEAYSAYSDDFSSLPSSPPSSLESNSDHAMSSPLTSSENALSPLAPEDSSWQPLSSLPTCPSGQSAPEGLPEYIYVPWDHNSKLTNDLDMLTELMRTRSLEGKRILVHCQCGVSRSASLIVAYVMRMQQWGLHESYEWVKSRAGSISPNMTLIFQLMEWGKSIQSVNQKPDLRNRGSDIDLLRSSKRNYTFL